MNDSESSSNFWTWNRILKTIRQMQMADVIRAGGVFRADLPLPNHTSAGSRRAPSFVLKSSLRRVIEFWLSLLKSRHYCYTSSRYKRALIRMKAAPLPRWLCWYCRNPPVRLARGFFKNNKGVPSDFFPVVFCETHEWCSGPWTLEVYIQTWDALQPSLVLLCSFNIFDFIWFSWKCCRLTALYTHDWVQYHAFHLPSEHTCLSFTAEHKEVRGHEKHTNAQYGHVTYMLNTHVLI